MSDVSGWAAELFAAGKSVNAVAKALGITWERAKALQGGATQPKSADTESDDYSLSVTVSPARFDAIFAGFSEAEKAAAVQAGLQARIDK